MASTMETLPPENTIYGSEKLLDSASVAIAIAEEGESAISISMRRIPDVQDIRRQPVPAHGEMWSPIQETANASQNYGVLWSPIRETVDTFKTSEPMWSPIREPLNISQNYELWSPTKEYVDRFQNPTELWSPTPEPAKDFSASSMEEDTVPESVILAKGLSRDDSLQYNCHKSEVSASNISLVQQAGHNLYKYSRTIKASESVGAERLEVLPTPKVMKGPDDLTSSVGFLRDEELLIDVDRLQEAVEQLKKGKRKALQEDGQRLDFEDLPESPCKVARKSIEKAYTLDSTGMTINKDFSKTVSREGDYVEEFNGRQIKVVNSSTNSVRSSEELVLEQTQPIDTLHGKDVRGVKDIPALPLKVDWKSAEKSDALEGRGLTVKVLSKKVSAEDTGVEETSDSLKKVVTNVIISKDNSKEVQLEPNDTQPMDTLLDKDANGVKDVLEPPCKVARKSTGKTDAWEGRGLFVDKVFLSKKVSVEGKLVQKVDDCSTKVVNESRISIDSSKELLLEKNNAQPIEIVGKDVSGIKNVLEPYGKVAQKPTKTDSLEVRSLGASKVLYKKLSVEETNYCPSKVVNNSRISIHSSKDVLLEQNDTQPINTIPSKDVIRVDMQETPEVTSPVDVMDMVSDPNDHLLKGGGKRSNIQKGVRTSIIMHRETDLKDAECPSIAERIKQQTRDTVSYGAGEELRTVEVLDDKFMAAFKVALACTNEKGKEKKATVSRHRKSWWLAKVLNQNIEGKGARDSLTKKLYAGGTGRWDRDWDIAFWKERSARVRRAQKEAEDEIEGTGCTKKCGRGDDKETDPKEPDSIFNRLYIADTSLFPRNDDVQPLSAQVKERKEDISEMSGKATGKIAQMLVNKEDTRPQVIQDKLGKNQPFHSLLAPKMSDNTAAALDMSGLPEKCSESSGTVKEKSGFGKCLTTVENIKVSGSLATKDSSPKVPTKPKSMMVPAPTATKTQSNGLESIAASKSYVKKDKRQWALEVLARKTGNTGNALASRNAAGGSPSIDGQFSLLLQLPLDMRPLLPHNRHSKVPTAVRQVQLNRLVEQELRRAKLSVFQNSPECEEAVSRGKAREEELYKRSNSKGVYVNLCVRALAQTGTPPKAEPASESCVSDVVQKALEATGLVASPQASPCHNRDDETTESITNEANIPTVDNCKGKRSCADKWVDNVLEMDNLDIYGDFEFNVGSDLEDTNFLDKPLSKLEVPKSTHESESKPNKTNKMVVVLTIASQSNGPAEVHPNTAVDSQESNYGIEEPGVKVKAAQTSELLSSMGEAHLSTGDVDDLYSGLDLTSLNTEPTIGSSLITTKSDSHSHTVQPDMGLVCENPKSIPCTSEILERNIENSTDVEGRQPTTQVGSSEIDDWMNAGKFADLDRRIENVRQSTFSEVNGGTDLPWKPKVHDEMESTKRNDLRNSVQKQVEIYVNQHLKPLYKSGVIKADQFRYAVSRTASKVMEHHENASSADFLITEGSKVKKLADQYLQAFSKRKVS